MNELLPFPNSNIILTSHENTSCTVSSTSMMETLHDLLQRISSQYNIPSHLLTSQVLIQTNSHENLASNSTNLPPLNSSFEHLMELAHSSWISNFLLQINNLLLYLRPAMTTLLQQKVILDHIVKILYKCLGTIAFPIGVAITHVILPGEKIDMTVFLPNPVDTKWHLKFHETLYPDNPLENPPQLTSVQFFNKEKTASLSYGDIGVNISVNDIAALYNSALYEDVDNLLSNDGLMKCSYLLIKSWIVHDSEVPTGNELYS